MRVTADSLDAFYSTPLGGCARAMVLRRLLSLWPDMAGQNALGFGFGAPFLDAYRKSANRTVLVSPAGQGAVAHRSSRGVMACVADDTLLPFTDNAFSRVLCVHALEEAEDRAGLLRELWRVTEPEGRIVVVAAGRAGLWARAESLPFGAGVPFTRTQLRAQLADAGFQPTVGSGALYGPPVARLMSPRLCDGFERAGELLWPGLAGLVMVEAIKRLYVEPDRGHRMRRRAPVFGTAAQPSLDTQTHERTTDREPAE